MSWRLYAAFRSAFRIVSLSFQVAPFIKLLWVLNDKAISRFVSILNEDLVWFPMWKEEQNYHKGETSQEVKLPCSSKRHLIRSKSYNTMAFCSPNCAAWLRCWSFVSQVLGTSTLGYVTSFTWRQPSRPAWSHDYEAKQLFWERSGEKDRLFCRRPVKSFHFFRKFVCLVVFRQDN